MILEDGPIF